VAYYASAIDGDGGFWSAYQNIKPIYSGSDWKKDVISPQTNFFKDVAKGKLRDVTWITPTAQTPTTPAARARPARRGLPRWSMRSGSRRYWDSTAIFIFWDDYGGWYDPEPPQNSTTTAWGFAYRC